MVRRVTEDTVVVIGLGRFGEELARTLMSLGRDVLAIERDPRIVARLAPEITLVVEADGTQLETLKSLGVTDVRTVVVATGASLEASLLATSALAELGVTQIWAKAVTHAHQRILLRVGATRVIFPELDMGNRVAHQLARGEITDYIEFGNGHALALVGAPTWMIGRTPADLRLSSTRHVLCVAVQRQGRDDFQVVKSDTRFQAKDILVVAGRTQFVEQFTISEH